VVQTQARGPQLAAARGQFLCNSLTLSVCRILHKVTHILY